MSEAGTIDGLQFVRDRGTRSGTLELVDLTRLAASDCNAASVQYAVSGGASRSGRSALQIRASGVLALRCQRCLGPVSWLVAVDVELELAESEEAIDSANDDVDRALATRSMDVAALVEDELMLALPMVSMHERCEALAKGSAPKPSPFAVLAELRKGADR